MNKYSVKVNGKSIEVEVELIEGQPVVTGVRPQMAQRRAATQSLQRQPRQTAASRPASAPAAPVAAAGAISAPMPGNVIDVLVKEGDTVKAGQVIIVFEAMKMENEIVADKDGVIAKISAEKGKSFKTGDFLAEIR